MLDFCLFLQMLLFTGENVISLVTTLAFLLHSDQKESAVCLIGASHTFGGLLLFSQEWSLKQLILVSVYWGTKAMYYSFILWGFKAINEFLYKTHSL